LKLHVCSWKYKFGIQWRWMWMVDEALKVVSKACIQRTSRESPLWNLHVSLLASYSHLYARSNIQHRKVQNDVFKMMCSRWLNNSFKNGSWIWLTLSFIQ
jgi:hypothetical protein